MTILTLIILALAIGFPFYMIVKELINERD